ncbi:VOC family protein [Pasteurella testudinis]|uniref:VOC family protein n=1 Tax=Pasteurella testudinis TaxID=761 RepID=UPI004057F0D8
MTNLTQPHPLLRQETALGNSFKRFEQSIVQLAGAIGLDLAVSEIDHLALRVNTFEQGEKWLAALLKCGRLLSENTVNGRPIYLVTLSQPLFFAGQAVSIIELPLPKNKRYPQQGWEHIEVVMPFLAKESPNEWLERVIRQFSLNENPQLRVKVDEPKVAGERLCNLSIAMTFIDNVENLTCIKFHPYSIMDIVKQEQ